LLPSRRGVSQAALDAAKAEYKQYLSQITDEHDGQIQKLEQTLSERNEVLKELRAREATFKERTAHLQAQLDQDAVTLRKNGAELDKLREALGDSTLREQREKERSLTMHEQAMQDLEARLSMQTEAQKRNFIKLKKAIVKMARKRPGNSTPVTTPFVQISLFVCVLKNVCSCCYWVVML
jgi:chromosome segregation ATPase